MSDKFTPDELVILAEACGYRRVKSKGMERKTFFVNDFGKVYLNLGFAHELGGIAIKEWRPDTDANQRDEVVEAMFHDDYYVSIEAEATDAGNIVFWAKVLDLLDRETVRLCQDTPGAAVCRAALEVLKS